MNRKGFTLIELMIVVAIIAIIAAVAIPGLLRSRIGANESAAIATLKALSTGQEQFKSAVAVDVNSNGAGEYGYLEELGGTDNCRGPGGADVGQTFSASSFIPAVLGTTAAAAAEMASAKSGYQLICYIPTGAAAANTLCDAGGEDVGLNETNFIAYAWPQTAGRSGVRTFVMDPAGQPYSFANSTSTYTGTLAAGIPAYDVALSNVAPATGVWGDPIAHNAAGVAAHATDIWVPVG